MERKKQIRVLMLNEFDQGHNVRTATQNIVSTYGDNLVCEATVRRWFHRFRSNDRELDDRRRSGRLDDEQMLTVLRQNPLMSTRQLSERLGVDNTIHYHLKALGKVNKRGIWLSDELKRADKQRRVNVCRELLATYDRSGHARFWDSLLTSDEKWVFFKNIRTHNQWLDPGQQPI